MNTYNENLRASIVNSLDEQAKSLQKTQSALSAQEISLYYAQGALISANDKFDATLETYEKEQDILTSVNENNNSGVNVIDAATQEKAYVDKAVNNTAVAASNVQIAANAIVQLAGDLGNALSIVSAASYKSTIHKQTEAAKANMDITAYNAELASQLAMESTMLASSITASTVLTESQSTGAALNALNEGYVAQFEATSTTLDAQNTAAVEANNIEKKAEGLTEDLNAANYGITTAYELSNLELNSGLKIMDGANKPTDAGFSFSFNSYLTPLYPKKDANGQSQNAVQAYYVIVVDSASKSTFSTTSAEAAITGTSPNGKPMFVKLDPGTSSLPMSYSQKVNRTSIDDSNGNSIDLGKEYCLFLYIKMTQEYKNMINNYEEVLSAGSENFKMTHLLNAVKFPASATPAYSGGKFEFKVTQPANYTMQYRVMFLPSGSAKVGNLLSDSNLPTTKKRAAYASKLAKSKANIKAAQSEIDKIKTGYNGAIKIERLEEHVTGAKSLTAAKLTKLSPEESKALSGLEAANATIATNQTTINELGKAKVDGYQTLGKNGVFFNLTLAEQVPTGLYKVAELDSSTAAGANSVSGTFQVTLDDTTTDNFGNKLIVGDEYIPVVLSYSTVEASEAAEYTNALSNFINTKSIKFSLT